MRVRLIKDRPGQPAGTIIEEPDSWRLVQFGLAEPLDAEAKQRCEGMKIPRHTLTKVGETELDRRNKELEAEQEKSKKLATDNALLRDANKALKKKIRVERIEDKKEKSDADSKSATKPATKLADSAKPKPTDPQS